MAFKSTKFWKFYPKSTITVYYRTSCTVMYTPPSKIYAGRQVNVEYANCTIPWKDPDAPPKGECGY